MRVADWNYEWELCNMLGQIEFKEKLNNVHNCYFSPRNNTEVRGRYIIEYRNGSFTTLHKDASLKTEVTLLYKSDDLEGGDLIVDGKQIDMEVGDTYTYLPEQKHEVTEVNKGVRRVLISWFHKNSS
tara:strand:+ start:193 stop:573 length:381 start_codon:yes stop_codon:yes gene_type:complete